MKNPFSSSSTITPTSTSSSSTPSPWTPLVLLGPIVPVLYSYTLILFGSYITNSPICRNETTNNIDYAQACTFIQAQLYTAHALSFTFFYVFAASTTLVPNPINLISDVLNKQHYFKDHCIHPFQNLSTLTITYFFIFLASVGVNLMGLSYVSENDFTDFIVYYIAISVLFYWLMMIYVLGVVVVKYVGMRGKGGSKAKSKIMSVSQPVVKKVESKGIGSIKEVDGADR